jgi:hypothetical protein
MEEFDQEIASRLQVRLNKAERQTARYMDLA